MFTGIVETTGKVREVLNKGSYLTLAVESEISHELRVDQSVAHNGVCLTVTDIEEKIHTVDVVEETLMRSNLRHLKGGDRINLERSLRATDRLDGHIVQGHVDATGICTSVRPLEGSHILSISFPGQYRDMLVDKGSVAVDGVSLTVIHPRDEEFSVAVIPYTFTHTTLGTLKPGMEVNLEFDILAKYLARHLESLMKKPD